LSYDQVTVDIYGHAVPRGNRAAVDRLDDAPLAAPNVTPAAPTGADEDRANPLSAVESVVSRVGIAPERRSRRLTPECLRITRRRHVERRETW
jgi:hypothetical protein